MHNQYLDNLSAGKHKLSVQEFGQGQKPKLIYAGLTINGQSSIGHTTKLPPLGGHASDGGESGQGING